MFSLEKGRPGGLMNVYKYMLGVFPMVPSEKTRGDEQKLKYRKFHASIRKTFLTVRLIKHWSKLSKEIWVFPSLKVFRI